MRIIGKNKDYYDSARGYGGVDNTTIYIRKREVIEVDSKKDSYANVFWARRNTYHKDWNFGLYSGSLFFCGKEYPYYNFQFPDNRAYDYKNGGYIGECMEDKYLYPNFHDDEIKSIFSDKNKVKKKSIIAKDRSYEYIMRSHLKNHKDNYNSIHLEFDCPVIQVIKQDRKYYVIKNPILKDIGFHRVLDPYQVFQELNMYMNGPLTKSPEAKPWPLGEKDYVRSKGFDSWSFRKRSANIK